MKLKSIKIKNFRTISELSISVEKLEDDTYTFGLIGINEAGKSNILKALALKDSTYNITLKDFKDKSEKISIEFYYIISSDDDKDKDLLKVFASKYEDERNTHIEGGIFSIVYLPEDPTTKCKVFELLSLDNGTTKFPLDINYADQGIVHKCIFWTAEEKFLISQPINQSKFASNPNEVSIPLKNCFLLAGYSDIAKAINSATDSTDLEDLQDTLGKSVTEHIKTVWPNHPISISFFISNGLINFHIKDESSHGKKAKARTADQRSDGFKQFISFLLTISAENKNNALANTILLLDEPETHLHPKAQEYLLDELKQITKNNRNNIVFFATHSNYMIDKEDLSRNHKVVKSDENTTLSKFSKTASTFASVTYEVFDIASTDYHNQLYGKLHEDFIDRYPNEDKSKQTVFDTEYLNLDKGLVKDQRLRDRDNACTLPTYIRNCIHHPENGNTFTEEQLRKSINHLRNYLGIN